ncbi:hypothetical protein HCH54_005265 [Aspergillus fumigatus]
MNTGNTYCVVDQVESYISIDHHTYDYMPGAFRRSFSIQCQTTRTQPPPCKVCDKQIFSQISCIRFLTFCSFMLISKIYRLQVMLQDNARRFNCPWPRCEKSFVRKPDLHRHHRIHTNERPHRCTAEGCNKSFIQRGALTVHSRTHTGERPYVCEICGCNRAFGDSSSFNRHRRTHTGVKLYNCPESNCNRSFARRETLASHQRRLHSQIKEPGTQHSTLSFNMPLHPLPSGELQHLCNEAHQITTSQQTHDRIFVPQDQLSVYHGLTQNGLTQPSYDLSIASFEMQLSSSSVPHVPALNDSVCLEYHVPAADDHVELSSFKHVARINVARHPYGSYDYVWRSIHSIGADVNRYGYTTLPGSAVNGVTWEMTHFSLIS